VIICGKKGNFKNTIKGKNKDTSKTSKTKDITLKNQMQSCQLSPSGSHLGVFFLSNTQENCASLLIEEDYEHKYKYKTRAGQPAQHRAWVLKHC
jgi:hypothetical protein